MAPLLSTYPSSPRVLATKANLDAVTKVATYQESEAIVRSLSIANPDNFRLRIMAAYMRGLGGEREPAIEELRGLVAQYPNEAYAHQSLAGLLHLEKKNWTEAWREYEIALTSGPLTSPCYKTAAFHVATKIDPPNANLALKGSSMLERAGIRTRSRGVRQMFGVFAIFYLAGILLLGGPNHVAGIVVGGVAIASALWAAYANDFACCKKCRNFWIGLGAFALFSFVLAYGSSTASRGVRTELAIYAAAVVVAVGIQFLRLRSLESRKESQEESVHSK